MGQLARGRALQGEQDFAGLAFDLDLLRVEVESVGQVAAVADVGQGIGSEDRDDAGPTVPGRLGDDAGLPARAQPHPQPLAECVVVRQQRRMCGNVGTEIHEGRGAFDNVNTAVHGDNPLTSLREVPDSKLVTPPVMDGFVDRGYERIGAIPDSESAF